jgi:hypothetical protein
VESNLQQARIHHLLILLRHSSVALTFSIPEASWMVPSLRDKRGMLISTTSGSRALSFGR